MRKIFGILCMVLFLIVGLSFGQIIDVNRPAAQENQGQSYQEIQLFGTQWVIEKGKVLEVYNELDAAVVWLLLRDKAGVAGFAEIVVITKLDGSRWEIVGGCLKPSSSEEQGFYLMAYDNFKNQKDKLSALLEPKGKSGLQLIWEGYEDANGDPILEFYILNTGDPTGGMAIKNIVRTINIKKFVEEHFKDEGGKK